MESPARDVCAALGSNKLLGPVVAGMLFGVLRDYPAPDALGAEQRGVAIFLNCRKATQPNLICPAGKRKGVCNLVAPSPRLLLLRCAAKMRTFPTVRTL